MVRYADWAQDYTNRARLILRSLGEVRRHDGAAACVPMVKDEKRDQAPSVARS
jgi:hypothetical protein